MRTSGAPLSRPISSRDTRARPDYRAIMASALTVVLVALGLLVLPHHMLIGGALLGLASLAWRLHSVRDEEAFITVLAVLAFLGAAIKVMRGISQWLL